MRSGMPCWSLVACFIGWHDDNSMTLQFLGLPVLPGLIHLLPEYNSSIFCAKSENIRLVTWCLPRQHPLVPCCACTTEVLQTERSVFSLENVAPEYCHDVSLPVT